jgi:hypothetical protein
MRDPRPCRAALGDSVGHELVHVDRMLSVIICAELAQLIADASKLGVSLQILGVRVERAILMAASQKLMPRPPD